MRGSGVSKTNSSGSASGPALGSMASVTNSGEDRARARSSMRGLAAAGVSGSAGAAAAGCTGGCRFRARVTALGLPLGAELGHQLRYARLQRFVLLGGLQQPLLAPFQVDHIPPRRRRGQPVLGENAQAAVDRIDKMRVIARHLRQGHQGIGQIARRRPQPGMGRGRCLAADHMVKGRCQGIQIRGIDLIAAQLIELLRAVPILDRQHFRQRAADPGGILGGRRRNQSEPANYQRRSRCYRARCRRCRMSWSWM